MKKTRLLILTIVIVIVMSFSLTACNMTERTDIWKDKFDSSTPYLVDAGTTPETANTDGWYVTLYDQFDDGLPEGRWEPVQNHLRKEEYWCESQITEDKENGLIRINAIHDENHVCDKCGGKSGHFTSGIITCHNNNGVREPLFEQAFGYFEARVKVPNSDGMWSAFWLQSNYIRNVGYGGEDGSEIDIYESSFFRNRSKVGNCVHIDGYQKDHRSRGAVHDVGEDVYNGYHTFALRWTPDSYTFYYDNKAIWATDFGGVCKTPCFLMLTNEIRHEGTYGPYGQRLGKFTGDEFLIDYVRVYQNVNYEPFIKSIDDYTY